jgi:hypothetical protein
MYHPILVYVTTRVLFLGMIDELVPIALQRSIAAGGVGIQATTRLDRHVRGLLHRLDGEILDRMDHDRTLSAAPRHDRWPVFVVMAPARRALLAATTRPTSQGLVPAVLCLPLAAGGVIEFIRFNRALQLAIGLVGYGSIAQPPTPVIARADMDTDLPGKVARSQWARDRLLWANNVCVRSLNVRRQALQR